MVSQSPLADFSSENMTSIVSDATSAAADEDGQMKSNQKTSLKGHTKSSRLHSKSVQLLLEDAAWFTSQLADGSASASFLRTRKRKPQVSQEVIDDNSSITKPRRKYTRRKHNGKADVDDSFSSLSGPSSTISSTASSPSADTQFPNSRSTGKTIKQEIKEEHFFDWEGPYFKPPYQLFDIEELQSNNAFRGTITPSTYLTTKYYNRHSRGNTPSGTNPPETVMLKAILFPEYEQEYHIDFSNEAYTTRYNPMSEIGKIIEYSVILYMPEQYRTDAIEQVVEPLNEAFDQENNRKFIQVIEKYNRMISNIPRDEIVQHLRKKESIPKSFIHDFLHFVYTRSIHPNARVLNRYTAFSSYVYGELLPNMLSEVYDQCGMAPDHIFMDLGSGVGNCVIQASLEYGCKLSFGCEIMPNVSDLTEKQYEELKNWCKLFGLHLNEIQFALRQSFVKNQRVEDLLKDCDILLVNNFLFDSKINHEVRKIIQNLKVGCKIISLKNIRPFGFTFDFNNVENILNRLHVERFDLREDSVSWTHSGGEYYISTVLRDVDESLFDKHAGHRKTKRPLKYTR